VVNYQIVGTLTDSLNDGLALWGSDLAMAPSVLLSPATPGASMGNFVCPQGINNPPCATGYGGTQSGNNLLQIGGGQNTIKNVIGNAPFPIGMVTEGVAQSQVVLATGSVTMPAAVGVYTLSLSNVFANEINDGQILANGAFFATSASGVGTVGSLAITVEDAVVLRNISSANPPLDNPFIAGTQAFQDVLTYETATALPRGIGASGTPTLQGITYATPSVTFDGSVSLTLPGQVTVSCTDVAANGQGDCPTVTAVAGAGAGPYTLTLSGVIPRRECTTFRFPGIANPGQAVQYIFLPGNANVGLPGGTIVSAADVTSLILALSNSTANVGNNPVRYNMDRVGLAAAPVTAADVARLIAMLNGSPTGPPAAGAVPACPAP
jgi:hypothetical protein